MITPIKVDDRPLYAQAIDVLRSLISEGGYEPGDRFPPEIELADELGIREVGERFGRMEMFLPEMVLSADAMEAAVAVLEPHHAGHDTDAGRGRLPRPVQSDHRRRTHQPGVRRLDRRRWLWRHRLRRRQVVRRVSGARLTPTSTDSQEPGAREPWS